MDDDFCIEFNRQGAVVAEELGSIASVPAGLLELIRGIAATDTPHCQFIWADGDLSRSYRIAVDTNHSRFVDWTIVVTGRDLVELPHSLTRRELDVLTLLAAGLSNNEIGEALGMSPRTVTTHVDQILRRKLGASSRTAAAVLARNEGLLKLPIPHHPEAAAPTVNDVLGLRMHQLNSAASRLIPVRKPLVIGAAFPVTGFASAEGIEMVQATQLAIDEINERGGVDGRLVTLQVADVDIMSATSIEQSLLHLASLGVDALTSGYLAHQENAHEIAASIGLPYLHATTVRALEERVRREPDRFGNVFQATPSDSNYAPRFVNFATALRDSGQWLPSSRRLLVVDSAWELSYFGTVEAQQLAESNGWEFKVVRPKEESATSWQKVAEYIRRTEPAAVLIGHFTVDGTVAFMEEFHTQAPDTLVYLVFAPGAPEFRERLGNRADGVVWATVAGTYSDAFARSFVSRFGTRYGRPPGRVNAGMAYDRVRVLSLAWSQTANPRDVESVTSELRRVIHRGVNGVYYFGERGQATMSYPGRGGDPSLAQAHLIFQIQNGRNLIIGPRPYADGVFQAPTWLRRTQQAVR